MIHFLIWVWLAFALLTGMVMSPVMLRDAAGTCPRWTIWVGYLLASFGWPVGVVLLIVAKARA